MKSSCSGQYFSCFGRLYGQGSAAARYAEDSKTSKDDGSEKNEAGMGGGWQRVCGLLQAGRERVERMPAGRVRIWCRKETVGIVRMQQSGSGGDGPTGILLSRERTVSRGVAGDSASTIS